MKNSQNYLQIDTSDNQAALRLLSQEYGAEARNGYVVLPMHERAVAAAAARRLIEQHIDVYLLQPQQNDLEQLFIDITSNHHP